MSVVVTHYEQPRQLARTLRALAGQRDPGPLEVVVADDGSRVAPTVPRGVRLVTQRHEGFGAARARNAGRAAARGDVLVFLDADTTPEPGFVAAVTALPARLHEAVVVGRRRHADLAATGPDADVSSVGPRHELPEPAWLREGYRRTRDLLDSDETSFRFVLGAALACGAAFFDETGGFDETFTAYGGEDWEWAHRAWTHGALLAHAPGAVAWHDGPDFSGRSGAGAVDRLRAETLATAARVPVPGVAPQGLITPGAADPVVTVAADLGGDALVITVDGILAALPRARVLLGRPQADEVGDDPRVEVSPGGLASSDAARSAWRHLHVGRPVTGPVSAWVAAAGLLAGPGAPGWVSMRSRDGEEAAVFSTLRAERRARRWGSPMDPRVSISSELTEVTADVRVQGRWGGWQ